MEKQEWLTSKECLPTKMFTENCPAKLTVAKRWFENNQSFMRFVTQFVVPFWFQLNSAEPHLLASTLRSAVTDAIKGNTDVCGGLLLL